MKHKFNQMTVVTAACVMLLSSVGCASLPWQSKKPAMMTSDQYVEQQSSNIQYANNVDFSEEYASMPVPPPVDAPPVRTAYLPSGSSDSGSCSSGCCN